MHGICPSRQPRGQWKCYPRQLGTNIPHPGGQFNTYGQRISRHAKQRELREEASMHFFGGSSRKSLKCSRSKGSWSSPQSQGKTGSEGKVYRMLILRTQTKSLTNPPRKVQISRQSGVCSLQFLLRDRKSTRLNSSHPSI